MGACYMAGMVIMELTTRQAAEVVDISHQYLVKFAQDRYMFYTGRIMKVGEIGLAFVWDEEETHIAAAWQADMVARKSQAHAKKAEPVLRRRLIIKGLRERGLMR